MPFLEIFSPEPARAELDRCKEQDPPEMHAVQDHRLTLLFDMLKLRKFYHVKVLKDALFGSRSSYVFNTAAAALTVDSFASLSLLRATVRDVIYKRSQQGRRTWWT
jgi:hypothetical protein